MTVSKGYKYAEISTSQVRFALGVVTFLSSRQNCGSVFQSFPYFSFNTKKMVLGDDYSFRMIDRTMEFKYGQFQAILIMFHRDWESPADSRLS